MFVDELRRRAGMDDRLSAKERPVPQLLVEDWMVTKQELEDLVTTLALDRGAYVFRSTSIVHGECYQVLGLNDFGGEWMTPIQFAERARAWLAERKAKATTEREETSSLEAAERLLKDLESRQGEP